MNANSIEKRQMELVKGGVPGQLDTMTVTYNTSTGETTVTNDSADPLKTRG